MVLAILGDLPGEAQLFLQRGEDTLLAFLCPGFPLAIDLPPELGEINAKMNAKLTNVVVDAILEIVHQRQREHLEGMKKLLGEIVQDAALFGDLAEALETRETLRRLFTEHSQVLGLYALDPEQALPLRAFVASLFGSMVSPGDTGVPSELLQLLLLHPEEPIRQATLQGFSRN